MEAAGEGSEIQPHHKLGRRYHQVSGGDFRVTALDKGNGWMSIDKVEPEGGMDLSTFARRLDLAMAGGTETTGPGGVKAGQPGPHAGRETKARQGKL